MEKKAPYKTRQQDLLLSYLKSIKGQHFTVEDVKEHFANKNSPIGVATIYRHLEKLISGGLVNKYIVDETSAACFEYIGSDSCQKTVPHFHLKCNVCGSLIHLECEELEQIRAHLKSSHNFELDSFKTVFYGTCSACQANGDKNGAS